MVMVQSVFFLGVYTFRYTQANYDVDQGFCPPQTTVNFPIDTRESSDSIPTNRTRVEDSARRGCVCDLKPCLAICPSQEESASGRSYVIDDYANYSMLPRVRALDGSLDEDAVGLDPREWFDIFVWRPCLEECMYSLVPTADKLDEFYLLSNGSLFLPGIANSGDPIVQGFEEYCLRPDLKEGTYIPRVCDWGCEINTGSTDIDKIQYIASLVAVPFIVVTVFVYSILPEFRNIHATALRCYLCCLAVTDVALAVDRLPTREFRTSTLCLCFGFFIYFSSIASFSWLNVICFDLWRRFGVCDKYQYRSLNFMGISDFHNERKKFLWYSIYVWSISILMTAICIGMELAPGIPELSRPGFNVSACWFSETAAPFYFYGPTGLSIFCNICLFVSTSMKLCQHEKNMRRDFDTGDSGCHNHNKTWFGVYLRLFVVMGVSWSTDTIFSFCEGPDYLWFLPGMVNALQGFWIFLILICKKSVWLSLKKLYSKKKKLPGTNEHRCVYILSPPSNEASRVVQNTPSESFSKSSEVTQEDTLI